MYVYCGKIIRDIVSLQSNMNNFPHFVRIEISSFLSLSYIYPPRQLPPFLPFTIIPLHANLNVAANLVHNLNEIRLRPAGRYVPYSHEQKSSHER